MSAKPKEFSAQSQLRAVGNSRGYIFQRALLAEARVKAGDKFRILVSDRRIIFDYPKPGKAHVIVPRPLSFYLNQRVKGSPTTVDQEIWPEKAVLAKRPTNEC